MCKRVHAPTVVWLAWLALLSALFAAAAGTNLDNFRPVSSDETWIMSASYKLATQGIFGSDLHAGFYHSERVYFHSLPVHYFLQAASFRVAGAGIAQARWVSLAATLVVVWVAGGLAFRWYGLAAGLLTPALLIVWRSDLTAAWPGLPLLLVARSGRYDAGAVAWCWLAIGLLDRQLRRPGAVTGLALGVCAGLAALTQFFGSFVLLLIGVVWIGRRRIVQTPAADWLLAGVLLVGLPYGIYVTRHLEDMRGQVQHLIPERFRFDDPAFYLSNLAHEPQRYAGLVQRPAPGLNIGARWEKPLSPWLLVLGVGPAFVYLSRRVCRTGAIGDRLLWWSLVVFEASLALLDSTKAPLYSILLLPSLCILLAASAAAAFRRLWSTHRLGLRAAGAGVAGFLALIAVWEGLRAYQVDYGQSLEVSDYLAFNDLLRRWDIAHQAGGAARFADQVNWAGTRFIIVNTEVLASLRYYPDELYHQFREYVGECTRIVAVWEDATYGRIEIRRVISPDAEHPGC